MPEPLPTFGDLLTAALLRRFPGERTDSGRCSALARQMLAHLAPGVRGVQVGAVRGWCTGPSAPRRSHIEAVISALRSGPPEQRITDAQRRDLRAAYARPNERRPIDRPLSLADEPGGQP